MEASANVTREEFNTAIEDISAKMDALMTTMSQLVQRAPPTAGDGRESRGGRHTAPGSDQGGLDRAPNTREAPSWQRHRAASSVGNASRESAHGEPPAHHVNPTSRQRGILMGDAARVPGLLFKFSIRCIFVLFDLSYVNSLTPAMQRQDTVV